MQAPDALVELTERYLDRLELTPELGEQQASMRYALEGGKRVRAVICLPARRSIVRCLRLARWS